MSGKRYSVLNHLRIELLLPVKEEILCAVDFPIWYSSFSYLSLSIRVLKAIVLDPSPDFLATTWQDMIMNLQLNRTVDKRGQHNVFLKVYLIVT